MKQKRQSLDNFSHLYVYDSGESVRVSVHVIMSALVRFISVRYVGHELIVNYKMLRKNTISKAATLNRCSARHVSKMEREKSDLTISFVSLLRKKAWKGIIIYLSSVSPMRQRKTKPVPVP